MCISEFLNGRRGKEVVTFQQFISISCEMLRENEMREVLVLICKNIHISRYTCCDAP